MTPKEFIEQLNAAQDEFKSTVSELAFLASQGDHPYLPGIARCVATLNALASARETDWDRMAMEAGKLETPVDE